MNDDPPAIFLDAKHSKHSKDDLQPIRPDLADLLQVYLKGRPADAKVFKMPVKMAMTIRDDLRRARAQWIRETPDPAERRERRDSYFLRETDASGKLVDFHALRNTFISLAGAVRREREGMPNLGPPQQPRVDPEHVRTAGRERPGWCSEQATARHRDVDA